MKSNNSLCFSIRRESSNHRYFRRRDRQDEILFVVDIENDVVLRIARMSDCVLGVGDNRKSGHGTSFQLFGEG